MGLTMGEELVPCSVGEARGCLKIEMSREPWNSGPQGAYAAKVSLLLDSGTFARGESPSVPEVPSAEPAEHKKTALPNVVLDKAGDF